MRACFDLPDHLRAAGALEPDSCGVPASPVRFPLSSGQRAAASALWLPQGVHAGLQIEHDHRVETGPFVGPQAWAWTWHITVSPWETVDSMRSVLHDKHAEVHFVIGARRGVKEPVVIQCLPLNEFGKGMMHPAGTPETNRAWNIQCEVCANEETIKHFSHYQALSNLVWLVTHGDHPRVPIANRLARSFDNDKRFTPDGYPRVKAHHGHKHAANNTHVDPTDFFEGEKLIRLNKTAPHAL
jgi:hypothetical protein